MYPSSDNEIISFLRSSDTINLSTWLSSGLETKSFNPLMLVEDPVFHLRRIFHLVEHGMQNKLRNVISRSISEWFPNPSRTNLAIIKDLSILAAFTRCIDATEHLCSILQNKWIDTKRVDDEEVAEDLIASLSGLSPNINIQYLFSDLFFSREPNSIFAAQLFVGLCKCDPNNFAKYFSRFHALYKGFPGSKTVFELDEIILQILEIVPISRISQDVFHMDIEQKIWLVDILRDINSTKTIELVSKLSTTLPPFGEMPTDLYEYEEQINKLRFNFLDEGGKNDIKSALYYKSLYMIRNKCSAQVASLYLYSKDGYLHRVYVEGIDSNGNKIDSEKWFQNEKYKILEDQNFITDAVTGDFSFIKRNCKHAILDLDKFAPKSKDKYLKLFVDRFSGIAVPLCGKSKIYGVISLMHRNPIRDDFYEFLTPYITAYARSISSAISGYRKDKQDILKDDLQSNVNQAQLNFESIDDIFQTIANRLISDNTSFCACVIRRRSTKNNQLDVVARAPIPGSNEFWDGWNNESIAPLNKKSPGTNEHPPVFIKMSAEGYSYFGNNSEWAKNRNMMSYARYFLLSENEQVIGSLSVYVQYPYDFHRSCKIFLNRIANLLSDFIYRVDSVHNLEEVFSQLKRQPKHVPKECSVLIKNVINLASEGERKFVDPYEDAEYPENIE
jgi:hypothetical protein